MKKSKTNSGKTEVIDIKEINKQVKKRKKRKSKFNLGIWKYFIAIGGVAIVTILFFTIWFYNSRGGLVTIKLDDYLTYNKLEEKTVVYIGSDDTISKEFTPVLLDVARKQGQQYQYINISSLKATDIIKLQNVFVPTQEALVVPMVIVIEKGEIVDTRKDKSTGTPTGMMAGYTNRDALIKFLKDNKVY